MKINSFLYASLLLFISACNGLPSNRDEVAEDRDVLTSWAQSINCDSGWEKFANGFFVICYPDDWTSNDTGTFGSDLVLTNSNIETMADGHSFAQNINVMKQEASVLKAHDIHNLDEFAAFNKDQVEKVLFQAKIFSFTKTKLGGIAAYKNIMTANQNGADLYFEQYLFKEKEYYFVMTFTAGIDIAEESKATANTIMNSIRFNQ